MKLFRFKSRWLSALINVIGLGIAFTVFLILMSQVWWDFRYDRFKGSRDIYVLEQPYPVQEGLYYTMTLRPALKAVADCSPDQASQRNTKRETQTFRIIAKIMP